MKRFVSLSLLAIWPGLLLFLALPTACRSITPAHAPAPVLLISIDGFRADYLARYAPPTLTELARQGVQAEALIPVFPTLTFPNHYTIVTGLYPDRHGIVGNTMFDSTLGRFSLNNREAIADGRWWADGEPIWVTAQRQGLRTATYFWPGSEAEIHGIRPTYWMAYDSRIPGEERVRQVLAWLDLTDSLRPHLITLYFSDVDHAGHEHGPEAPEVAEAVRRVDSYLQQLIEGLRTRHLLNQVNLLIVSDHGMATTSRERVIFLDDFVTVEDLHIVTWSPVLMLYPPPGREDAILADLQGAHPHLQVFHKKNLPAHLHFGTHRRIPPIVGIADEGWSITTRNRFAEDPARFDGGMHGYDPTYSSMHGLFIAHGPAFARGKRIPPLENIHLYALMCHLLGLTPAPNNGSLKAVEPMLTLKINSP
jgi:predicted AlkP superfamily pyrophosphatase or phosphodiesterase